MSVAVGASHFGILDYIVFSVVLAASSAIGIYYGIKANKTTDDFLLANKQMSPVPVTLSLISTSLSAINILGKLIIGLAHHVYLIAVVKIDTISIRLKCSSCYAELSRSVYGSKN